MSENDDDLTKSLKLPLPFVHAYCTFSFPLFQNVHKRIGVPLREIARQQSKAFEHISYSTGTLGPAGAPVPRMLPLYASESSRKVNAFLDK